MREPHPFSPYVAALGRGRTRSRPLTFEEAEDAMGMILRREVEPEQLGAFLMLLRVKEETPEEIAGFTKAAKALFELPDPLPAVDLDWGSYAGKRRQLPWYLLAALALVQSGVRLFMHGTEGHTPGRLYTRETLELLGLPVATSLQEAADRINASGFAYLPLEYLSPKLHEIIEMRPLFGLRSPVHTISRMLNPFGARATLQGIFHPGYMDTHQHAAKLLGEQHMAVFRGEGGEVECRPNKPFEVRTLHDGEFAAEQWPRILDHHHQVIDKEMDAERLKAVWHSDEQSDEQDEYATAAITGTLAVALKLMGRADTIEDALQMGGALWRARDRDQLKLAS